MPSLTLLAPAKLNLFLHITGKRADGYHFLESLVVFTSHADTLTFKKSASLSLSVSGEFATTSGNVEDNLVLRAARALQNAAECHESAAISLEKNIPVGAGLGGGSADAAATLNGLNQLWGLGLSQVQLHAIAVSLGADVAMCLAPKPAIVRGIGDKIAPLSAPLPPMAALLVHPRVPLLTQHVYAAYRPAGNYTPWQFKPHEELVAQLAATRNDLETAATQICPAVSQTLAHLKHLQPAPAFVRMTGSGACCFALYHTLEKAHAGKAHFDTLGSGWWSCATTLKT